MNGVTDDPTVPANNGGVPPPSGPAEQPKSGKSREEIYLELAKLSQQSFQSRQSYEWKVAFGLWTAIGVITYFATVHAGAISGWGLFSLAVAYILVGVVWAIVWQPLVHSANRIDKRWKHYYAHRAENRPEDRSEPDPWKKEEEVQWWWRRRERWLELREGWAWVQIAVTVVLLVVSFVIIQAKSDGPPVPASKDLISVSGDNATKVIDKLVK